VASDSLTTRRERMSEKVKVPSSKLAWCDGTW